MRLRRLIFCTCILILSVLVFDGISALSVIAKRNEVIRNTKHKVSQKIGYKADKEPSDITPIDNLWDPEESSITSVEPVNLLILGLDREGERSDAIILVNYSPDTGKIKLLSIARDTRVRSRGGYWKINALVALGGEDLIIGKVEELTGLSIDYYLSLDFVGFRKVVDALGGVEFYVPMNMDYDDPEQNLHIHLKKGNQILNGVKAEQFVRYRKGNKIGEGYQDGDIDRMRAQQNLIKSLIEQKLKIRYLNKIDDLFFILGEHMRTNIQLSDISYFLPKIRNIRYNEIETYTVPGESVYANKLWYFIYDKKKLQDLIEEEFMYY